MTSDPHRLGPGTCGARAAGSRPYMDGGCGRRAVDDGKALSLLRRQLPYERSQISARGRPGRCEGSWSVRKTFPVRRENQEHAVHLSPFLMRINRRKGRKKGQMVQTCPVTRRFAAGSTVSPERFGHSPKSAWKKSGPKMRIPIILPWIPAPLCWQDVPTALGPGSENRCAINAIMPHVKNGTAALSSTLS